jgi:hypothetical protein
MRNLLKASGIVAAVAFAAFAPGVVAEELSFKLYCQEVGGSGEPEPAGDRAGHMMSVDQYSCRMEGGPMDGAVVTGNDVTDWDKAGGVLLVGNAVARKPGAFAAYQDTEGKVALTIADGKVTGATGVGKIHWVVATGGAAPLAGKTFSYTFKATGPGNGRLTRRRSSAISANNATVLLPRPCQKSAFPVTI